MSARMAPPRKDVEEAVRATIEARWIREGDYKHAPFDHGEEGVRRVLDVLQALGLVTFNEPKPPTTAHEVLSGERLVAPLLRERMPQDDSFMREVLGSANAHSIERALNEAGFQIVRKP